MRRREDLVRVDAIGLRMEVEQDAMAQHGRRESSDVFVGHVIALTGESPSLGGEHDELCGANAATVVHIFLDEVGRAFTVVPRRAHQAHDVTRQRFGNGHHAHQLLKVEQLFCRGNGFDLRRRASPW